MKKYLVQVELRYCSIPKSEYDFEHHFEYTTIGVYDDLKEAINEGNKALKEASKSGLTIRDEFGEHNGCFGRPNTLVTNLSSRDGIQCFAKITTLHYRDLGEEIKNAIESDRRYDKWRKED